MFRSACGLGEETQPRHNNLVRQEKALAADVDDGDMFDALDGSALIVNV